MWTRSFTLLIASTFVSVFGSAASLTVLPWAALQTTKSTSITGIVTAAEMAPVAAAAFFTGVLLNRYDARRVRICSDLLGSVMALTLSLLFSTSKPNVIALVAAALLYGTVRSPAPAASLVLLEALPRPQTAQAEHSRGIYVAAVRLGYVLGAPTAGFCLSLLSVQATLMITAGAYILSTSLVVAATTRWSASALQEETKRDVGPLDGLRLVIADPVLRALAPIVCLLTAMSGAWSTVVSPAYGQQILGSSTRLGFLLGALSAGAVLGSIYHRFIFGRLPSRVALLLAGGGQALLVYAGAAMQPSFVVLIILFFTGGLATGGLSVAWISTITARSGARGTGAAYGFCYGAEQASAVLGAITVGYLLQFASISLMLAVFACAGLTLSLLGLRFSKQPGSLVSRLKES